jgi:hypothetical protein
MSKQLSTLFMRLVGIKIRDRRKEDFKFSVFSGGLLCLQFRSQFASCSASRHDLGGNTVDQLDQHGISITEWGTGFPLSPRGTFQPAFGNLVLG